jgi:hypothetical protein
MKPGIRIILGACATLLMSGCAATSSAPSDAGGPPEQPSNLTPGMVKLKIVKGQTTQAEVVEVFGPPDLVTHKDDMDIWTWDKTSYNYDTSWGFLWVLVAGTGGDRVRSSSHSMMLIVYFDQADRVMDYRLSAIKF